MLNVIRSSQIIGLMAVDGTTTTQLGAVEDIWLDEAGRIAYLSSSEGYLPLEQVSGIGTQAISTYGQLVVLEPSHLHRLHRLAVQSAMGEPLGWIEDFLFDWQTGQIAAYLVAGDVAEPFGGLAVLDPEDVQEIAIASLIVRSGGEQRLTSETEGLKGFLTEKSHQVRHLVRVMGDRLHETIAPEDRPETVRVKITAVSDELTDSGYHDRHAISEATQFLHDRWESLQHQIGRASHRAQAALESAWKQLTSGKT
jgi:uncharacterized protein YrrD